MGLVLPSPAYIVWAIFFGIIGYLVSRRGRKSERSVLTWSGVALMLYPYAVSETWLLLVIGAVLCSWVYYQ
jgi:hypothetical protein